MQIKRLNFRENNLFFLLQKIDIMPSDTKTSHDGTRSKIGDLSRRTEEVLLLLVADVEDLRDKLESEISKTLMI